MKHLREFGKFQLDARKQVLWCEDKPVNLALKEIELLCVLTENGGEVVTKDELLEKVWGGSFVEESNLSRHIYVLRKTFRDFGETEELIQTVPRRGYRFAAAVREVEYGQGELVIEKHTQTLIEIQADQKKEVRVKWGKRLFLTKYLSPITMTVSFVAVIGLIAFLVYQNRPPKASSPRIKSIGVLPFKIINTGKENQQQDIGLADILITRLSQVRDINVRPTSTILAFENQEVDAISAGEKLKVEAVLEGTIYRTNDKVRVTARLVKVGDNSSIWSGQFEKLVQDELKLQDEIALQVVDALALSLGGGKNTSTGLYTENADAYQLYLKGRYEWNRRNWAGAIEAERLFRGAIEKDPNFTLAYVGLADTMALSKERSTETIGVIEKALEREPNLAEAHATLGFIYMFHFWDWKAAESAFKKSIEQNPGNAKAHHWYAELLSIEGRHEEATAEMRRALEINPLSHNFLADLGQIYYFKREYKEAEEYCKKALEIYPDFQFAHIYLYFIYLQTGEYDRAAEEILAAEKIQGAFANQSAESQKHMEANLDEQRKFYREDGIKKFVENRTKETQDGNLCYVIAKDYAFLGEKEKTLACLEKAYEDKSFLSAFVKADPVFDRFRQESRYQEILRKMNLNN